MHTYLRIVNPAVAVVVLALCIWAATHDNDTFRFRGLVLGGMHTYFFAKGLFSASAVFLLGRILMKMLEHGNAGDGSRSLRMEALYVMALVGLVLSLLTGLFPHKEQKKAASPQEVKIAATNPAEIAIVEHYVVRDVQPLRIAGKLRNGSGYDWESVLVLATVGIDGRFAAQCRNAAVRVGPNAELPFSVVCDNLNVAGAGHGPSYRITIEAERKSRE
ncbi:MAG: hypothetical protein IT529_00215 [Burkholderiales bacterium]|nr:hypothetical protein [Burkholderiales bacterium]